jgi:hypothetical protein
MKKYFLAAVVLFIVSFSFAGENNIGLGIGIGSMAGVSGRYALTTNTSLAGFLSLAYGTKLCASLDSLIYNYSMLPIIEDGKLPIYYGCGLDFLGRSFGIHATVGAEYFFKNNPFGVFIQLSPVYMVYASEYSGVENFSDLHFNGMMGARYYFKL